MSNKLNIRDETLGMWLGVIGVAISPSRCR